MKSNIDALISADDAGITRPRYELPENNLSLYYAAIERLEAAKGSPPTFLQLQQEMEKVHAKDFEVDHPFNKTAIYWPNKVYMPKDMAYASMNKWNDDFLLFNERF